MIERETLEEYDADPYLRVFLGAEPGGRKTGTIPTLYRGAEGQVVDSPAHIHVIACDQGGLLTLKELAKLTHPIYGPLDWMNQISVYRLDREVNGDFHRMADPTKPPGTSLPLWDKLWSLLGYLGELSFSGRMGKAAVWVSGVGDLVAALQREIRTLVGRAPPDVMEQFRWGKYGRQIDLLQAGLHTLNAHLIWECQVYKFTTSAQGEEKQTDSTLMQGKQGTLFAGRCAQAVRVEREAGVPGKPGKLVFNLRPEWEFRKTTRGESWFDPSGYEPADWSVICKKRGLPLAKSKEELAKEGK